MLELLRKRRSIRLFKKERISPAHIDALKEAVLRSPSSRGIQPWKFWFVQDADLIGKLSRSKEQRIRVPEGRAPRGGRLR